MKVKATDAMNLIEKTESAFIKTPVPIIETYLFTHWDEDFLADTFIDANGLFMKENEAICHINQQSGWFGGVSLAFDKKLLEYV